MVQWCEDRGFWVEFLKKFYIDVSIEFFIEAALPVLYVPILRLLRYFANKFNIVKLPYFWDGGSTLFWILEHSSTLSIQLFDASSSKSIPHGRSNFKKNTYTLDLYTEIYRLIVHNFQKLSKPDGVFHAYIPYSYLIRVLTVYFISISVAPIALSSGVAFNSLRPASENGTVNSSITLASCSYCIDWRKIVEGRTASKKVD